jgi:hypothetical protein
MDCTNLARLGTLFLLPLLSNHSNAMPISSLVINEVMVNPSAVSDIRGEWFELYNPTGFSFDLDGLELKDDGSDSHIIDQPLWINPGEFLVFARNGDASVNGGFAADYVYRNFSLANNGDEIIFADAMDEVLRFNYGADFEQAGRSRERLPGTDEFILTAAAFTYGHADNWADNLGDIGGDIGTPGAFASSDTQAAGMLPLPSPIWLVLPLFGAMAGVRAKTLSSGQQTSPDQRASVEVL